MTSILVETGGAARRLDVKPYRVRLMEERGELAAFAITEAGRRLFLLSDVEALRLRRAQDKARSVGT
jgi:DNA-binding transcriptional MerR regulator